jgi:hypothetical protein
MATLLQWTSGPLGASGPGLCAPEGRKQPRGHQSAEMGRVQGQATEAEIQRPLHGRGSTPAKKAPITDSDMLQMMMLPGCHGLCHTKQLIKDAMSFEVTTKSLRNVLGTNLSIFCRRDVTPGSESQETSLRLHVSAPAWF